MGDVQHVTGKRGNWFSTDLDVAPDRMISSRPTVPRWQKSGGSEAAVWVKGVVKEDPRPIAALASQHSPPFGFGWEVVETTAKVQ
jgi:hypothetical protein